MKKVSVQCRGVRLAFGATEVLKGVDLDVVRDRSPAREIRL